MVRAEQTLIRSGDLARELNISLQTLCRWSADPKGQWQASMLRRGWYLVPKLRAAQLLPPVPAVPAAYEGAGNVG